MLPPNVGRCIHGTNPLFNVRVLERKYFTCELTAKFYDPYNYKYIDIVIWFIHLQLLPTVQVESQMDC